MGRSRQSPKCAWYSKEFEEGPTFKTQAISLLAIYNCSGSGMEQSWRYMYTQSPIPIHPYTFQHTMRMPIMFMKVSSS